VDLLTLLILKDHGIGYCSDQLSLNLAMEEFKAEELVHSVVFLTKFRISCKRRRLKDGH